MRNKHGVDTSALPKGKRGYILPESIEETTPKDGITIKHISNWGNGNKIPLGEEPSVFSNQPNT